MPYTIWHDIILPSLAVLVLSQNGAREFLSIIWIYNKNIEIINIFLQLALKS
jgi:hypothetical protein